MPNYTELAESLAKSLELTTAAIAVRFAGVDDATPMHAGAAPAGCQFWERGATATFATTAADHALCSIGVHTHNLEPTPAQQKDLMDTLRVLGELTYVRADDVPQIPVLRERPAKVVYGPLADAEVAPDVVLLFVRADQTLVLSEATQQLEGRNAPAMGRPACAIVPQAVNTQGAALSLGCCGARAYLDVFTPDVAIFAIPGARLEAYAERIGKLAAANAMLGRFHASRRAAVEAGERPAIEESLAAFQAAG
ncbi:MAG: DUF169 domain-containing protein [Acidobacteria bacterium]|nr:DUF169 domain-containing protein [Acidobacteriota bacterium]